MSPLGAHLCPVSACRGPAEFRRSFHRSPVGLRFTLLSPSLSLSVDLVLLFPLSSHPLPVLRECSNPTRLGFFLSDCLCCCGACACGFGEGTEVRSRSNPTTLVPADLHCVRDLGKTLSGKLFMPHCYLFFVSVMPCDGTKASTFYLES